MSTPTSRGSAGGHRKWGIIGGVVIIALIGAPLIWLVLQTAR